MLRTDRRTNAHRRWISICLLAVLGTALGWLLLAPLLPDSATDQVERAWSYSHTAASYAFETSALVTTHPTSMVSNIGRQPATHPLYVKGEVDQYEEAQHLIIKGYPLAQRYVEMQIANGQARGRSGPDQAWQSIDSSTDLSHISGDDPLGLIAAIEDVQMVGDSADRHYTFKLNGPRYAEHMRGLLEQSLREQGRLPANQRLAVADVYVKMQASGAIWLNSDGLPTRIEAQISFPAAPNAPEWYEARIITTFADWNTPLGATVAQLWHNPRQLALALGLSRKDLGNLSIGLGLMGLLALATAFVLRNRQSRRLYTALAGMTIAALVLTPLLQSQQSSAFAASQPAAPAAAPATSAAPAFNPLANPLEQASAAASQRSIAGRTTSSSVSADPNCTNGYDDGDGIAADIECNELGTDPADPDTDHDLISDGAEIKGFTVSGKTWYLNPLSSDSNGDGVSDVLECPTLQDISASTGAKTTASGTTCADSDGNGVPDAYDYDDDGDGVPDNADANSNAYLGSTSSGFSNKEFSYAVNLPSSLTMNSLFVNFQLRPTNADLLWQNGNVLDWPHQDTEGQITRNSDTTYYEYNGGSATYSDSSNVDDGNILIKPVLEIEIPYDTQNPSGGLPRNAGYANSTSVITGYSALDWLDTATLAEYGISYSQADDGSTLLLYVPLTTVEDSVGSTPVALGGSMYYEPGSSTWGQNHTVRLAWNVYALIDTCDTSAKPDDTEYSEWCAADETEHWTSTSENLIQTYYENFYVTALTAWENHGVELSMFAQSTATANYDSKLWGLADKVVSDYMAGKLESDGSRMTAHDIDSHFSNWGISGINTEELTLPDAMQLSYVAAITNSLFLEETFPAATANDIETVLYAGEETYRAAALSSISTSSTAVSLDLSSESLNTVATTHWSAFTYDGTSWADTDLNSAASALESGLANVFSDSVLSTMVDGETISDAAAAQAGAVFLAENYYLGMYYGDQATVAINGTSIGSTTVSSSAASTTPAVTAVETMITLIADYYSDSLVVQEIDSDLTAMTTGAKLASSLSTILETFGDIADGSSTSTLMELLVQLTNYAESTDTTVVSAPLLTAITAASYVGRSLTASLDHKADLQSEEVWTSTVLEYINTSWKAVGLLQSTTELLSQTSKFQNLFTTAAEAQEFASEMDKVGKVFTVVNFAINLATAIIPFAMAVSNGDIQPGTVAFSQQFNLLVAAIIFAIVLLVLELTGLGFIVLILDLIDFILAIMCESGDYGEESFVCTGLQETIVSWIANAMSDYQLIVNLKKEDRLEISIDSISVDDSSGADGFVAGNNLTVVMNLVSKLYPVRTNGEDYKDGPDLSDALKDTKVEYKLQTSEAAFAASSIAWTKLAGSYRKYYDIYESEFTRSGTASLSKAGINKPLGLYLSEHMIASVEECASNFFEAYFGTSSCRYYDNEFDQTSHSYLGDDLVFDVLPASLSDFLKLASVGQNSYRLSWDTSFPTLVDADGDGLISQAFGGPDPSDKKADTDGDGLSDYWEYANGYDMEESDADGDGLYDYWEALYSTDPAHADSDSDGISDGLEVYHPTAISPFDNTTTTWSGGWMFTYDSNASTLVSSDPAASDSDDDGIIDNFEQVYGFNPNAPSALKVLSLDSQIDTPAYPGVVGPGDQISYSATITNELDLRTAQGVLEVELPSGTTASTTVLDTLLPNASTSVSGSLTASSPSVTTAQTMTVRAGATISTLDNAVMVLPLTSSYNDGWVYGHNASCSGSACPIISSSSGSATFDGGDKLTVADSSDFDFSTFAIALAVKQTSSGTDNLIYKGSKGFKLYLTGTTLIGSIYQSDCSTQKTVSTAFSADSTWHDVALSYNGAKLLLYLDGVLAASTTVTSLCNNDEALTIGENLNGSMADITLYNEPLAADQVEETVGDPLFTADGTYGTFNGTMSVACSELEFTNSNVMVGDTWDFCTDTTLGIRGSAYAPNGYSGAAVFGQSRIDPVLNDNTFSMSGWIYPENAYASGTSTDGSNVEPTIPILESGNALYYNATLAEAPPSLYLRGKNVLVRFGHADDSNYCEAYTTNSPITYNTWSHVIVTYDNSQFTLYLNGVATGTWATNGKCAGYDAYQFSNFGSASRASAYRIGYDFSPAIYFDSIYVTGIASGENGGQEAYIYTNGTIDGQNNVIWTTAGNVIKNTNTTYAINKWAHGKGDYTGVRFTLCERDTSDNAWCSNNDTLVDSTIKSVTSSVYATWPTNYYKTYSADFSKNSFKGSLNYTVYGGGFKGMLDDLSLYDHDLSAADAAALYEQQSYGLDLNFDEATGQSTFADSSGNDVTVTCSSSAGTCPESGLAGRNGQALHFDGSDYLTVGSEGSFDYTVMTVAAWVKVDTFDQSWQALVTKGNTAWRLQRYSSSNFASFTTNGLSNVDLAGTTNINDGKWHHVAGVYDGAKKYLYVDGKLDSSISVTGSISTNDNAVMIGYNPERTNRTFKGYLDDVVLLNRALSQSEVQALLNRAPVLNMHLDEAYGDSTFESSAYSSYASSNIYTATCTSSACPQAGAPGQMREGVLFDGNDTLSFTAGDDLDLDDDFTIGMWVKPTDTKSSTLLRKSNGSGAAYNYNLWTLTDGTFKFDLHPSSTCTSSGVAHVQSAGKLIEDQWNHIMVTYDADSVKLTIYLNGAYDNDASYGSTASPACTTGTVFDIGPSFVGSMDEISVYDNRLSSDEIAAIYEYQVAWFDATSETAVVIDAAGPEVALDASGSTLSVAASSYVELGISASDADSAVAAVQYAINGGSYQDATLTSDGTSTWTFNFTPTSGDGAYTINLKATDSVGNVTSATGTLKVDATAPTMTLVSATSARAAAPAAINATIAVADQLSLTGTFADSGTNASGINADTGSVDLLDWKGASVNNLEPISLAYPDTSAVALLRLDDAAGSTSFSEDFGSGVSATCTGTSCPTAGEAGYHGNALTFDGTNDYLTLSGSSLNLSGGPFTEAAWIYPTFSDTSFHGVMGYQSTTTATRAPSLWVTQGTKLHGGFGDGTNWNSFVTGSVLTLNAWNHIAATFDGTTYTVYVNGSSVYSTTAFSGRHPYAATTLWVGKVDTTFKGMIDEAAIYSRALSASEITAIVAGNNWQADYSLELAQRPIYGTYTLRGSVQDYAANTISTTLATLQLDSEPPLADLLLADTAITATGTVLSGVVSDVPYPSSDRELHLHFEEASGATSFDDGSSNHASASCSGTACPSAGQSGQQGSALSFDGINDTLTIANDSAFEDTPLTLMAWIKPTWTSGDPTYNPAILGLRSSTGSGTTYSWHITKNYSRMELYNGSTVGGVNISMNPNQWYHVALVWEDGTWTGYVDGVAVGTVSESIGTATGRSLHIGSADGTREYFPGMIDELAIYGQALSAAEIYAIAHPLDTAVDTVQLRFRHLQDASEANDAGTWYTTTLGSSSAVATTWSYTLTAALEGPYLIDLKTSDALGNSHYLLGTWSGNIDTVAPRVQLDYTQLSGSTAQVSCTATDYNLTTSGWSCPVADSYRTASYVSDTWFSDFFGSLQQLEQLTTSAQVITATSASMTACDSAGHCATATNARPSGSASSAGSAQHPLSSSTSAVAAQSTMQGAAEAIGATSAQHPVISTARPAELAAPTATGVTLTLALSMTMQGQPISPNTTIRTPLNPPLTARWAAAGGASPVTSYHVTWYSYDALGTATPVFSGTLPASATSHVFNASEAQRLTVTVTATTSGGESASASFGPVYADSPLTPAYVSTTAPAPTGWQETACNVLGVDRRLPQQLTPNSPLDHEQRFFVTWNNSALQLAWSGADWSNDGDLFIYLDTQPGGSPRAYNPYPATISTTAVLLPLIGPTNQPQPMTADFVVWVRDGSVDGASLLAWNPGNASWETTPSPFFANVDTTRSPALTTLVLPFATLNINDPANQPLALVALASTNTALDIWSAMPIYNNVNSAAVVGSTVRDSVQLFTLLRAYTWPQLAPGMCPSGVDDLGQRWRSNPGDLIENNGADISAQVQADPTGITYALFHHNLIFAHQGLLPDQTDWSAEQSGLCQPPQPGGPPPPPECVRAVDDGRAAGMFNTHMELARLFSEEHPTVSSGQTITYTVHIVNSGLRRAEGVTVEATTPAALRLPGGQIIQVPEGSIYQQIIPIGTLQPGETRDVVIVGIVDPNFNPQQQDDHVRLRVQVFDETGLPGRPSEDMHIDHELDTAPPQYVELQAPAGIIGQGLQTLSGFVVDQSPVPTIMLELDGQTFTCSDPTPADSRWSCPVDLGSRSDGASISVRLKARDSHGQESAWFNGPTLVVDTLAPSLELDAAIEPHMTRGDIGGYEVVLSGPISDNRVVAGVEVCDSSQATANCQPAQLTLDPATITRETYSYTDTPATPLDFGSTTACGTSALTRTFTVADSFTVADLDVGLLIAHPFRNDVVARLQSPAGTTVELVSHGAASANLNVWLNDAATRSVFIDDDLADHPISGTLFLNERRPFQDHLFLFNGEQAQGVWSLAICDHYPAEDDGQYLGSQLRFHAAVTAGATQATWRYQLPLSSNSVYSQPLTVYGYDTAGNRSQPLTVAPEIDTQSPMVQVTTTTPLSGTAPVGPLRFAGTVQDDHAVTLNLLIRSQSGHMSTAAISSSNGLWEYTNTAMFTKPGTYCVWAHARDLADNLTIVGPYALLSTGRSAYTIHQSAQLVFLPLVLQPQTAALAQAATPPLRAQQASPEFSSFQEVLFIDSSVCQ